MIDNFALLLSHGLVLLTCWRLLSRDDLDREQDPAEEAGRTEATPTEEIPGPGGWGRRG